MYAARLATALRARTGAQIFGMGGSRMAEAGVELVADYHEVAVVGITEVLHKIPMVVSVQRRLAREARRRRPALASSWTRQEHIWALRGGLKMREFPSATSSGRKYGHGARGVFA